VDVWVTLLKEGLLLIFLAPTLGTRRNWHQTHETDLVAVAGASTGRVPLPLSMSGSQRTESSHYLHIDPDM